MLSSPSPTRAAVRSPSSPFCHIAAARQKQFHLNKSFHLVLSLKISFSFFFGGTRGKYLPMGFGVSTVTKLELEFYFIKHNFLDT